MTNADRNRTKYPLPPPKAAPKSARVLGVGLGKWHGKRTVPRPAACERIANGKPASPVMSASYDPVDVRAAQWLADKRGVPVASILRDALYAYLLPIRADVPPAFKPEESHGTAVQRGPSRATR